MIRRGVGGVVGPILIVMIVVIAAGIFLSVYLRSVRDVANRDLPLCVGIDLKMIKCVGFLNGYPLPNGQLISGNGIYFIVERAQGGGEIRDLRFKITDSEGKSRVERPINVSVAGIRINTAYQQFVEHSTKEAALLPYSLTPQGGGIPCEVAVSAVVGDSNTICAPTSEPIECLLFDSGSPNAVPPTPPQLIPMPSCS